MSSLAHALIAELDDEALDALAAALAPRLGSLAAIADMPSPALLSPQQAAERLGCSRRTIYRALTDGTLVGQRVGTAWRVRSDDVDAWATPAAPNAPRRRHRTTASSTPHSRAAVAAITGRGAE